MHGMGNLLVGLRAIANKHRTVIICVRVAAMVFKLSFTPACLGADCDCSVRQHSLAAEKERGAHPTIAILSPEQG